MENIETHKNLGDALYSMGGFYKTATEEFFTVYTTYKLAKEFPAAFGIIARNSDKFELGKIYEIWLEPFIVIKLEEPKEFKFTEEERKIITDEFEKPLKHYTEMYRNSKRTKYRDCEESYVTH